MLAIVMLPSTAVAPPTPAAIDAIAQRAFASGKAPGFSLAVQWNDELYCSSSFGIADAATHKPVTSQTRFAIGSISKQFAAVSILQLAEGTQLLLTDPVAKYLPELPNAKTITVRMLLNQTSGLRNYPFFTEYNWPRKGRIAPSTLIAILATDRPGLAPGTRFGYSNANYLALAAIVEKVSGLSYSEYLKKSIFEPLGMIESGNGFAAQNGLAVPEGGQGDPRRPLSLDLFTGAGSIVSTAPDMARWDQALMSGKLLNPASMHLLWTPGTSSDGSKSKYAMGFVAAQINEHRELWHNGLTPTVGGYNLNAIFPEGRLAVIVLSNGPDFAPQPEKLVSEIYTAFYPQTAQTPATLAVPKE